MAVLRQPYVDFEHGSAIQRRAEQSPKRKFPIAGERGEYADSTVWSESVHLDHFQYGPDMPVLTFQVARRAGQVPERKFLSLASVEYADSATVRSFDPRASTLTLL